MVRIEGRHCWNSTFQRTKQNIGNGMPEIQGAWEAAQSTGNSIRTLRYSEDLVSHAKERIARSTLGLFALSLLALHRDDESIIGNISRSVTVYQCGSPPGEIEKILSAVGGTYGFRDELNVQRRTLKGEYYEPPAQEEQTIAELTKEALKAHGKNPNSLEAQKLAEKARNASQRF